MNDQADSPREELAAGLPVISGARWFDPVSRPVLIHIECPLTFDEVVAALYNRADADDMASAEDLCGVVAVTLLLEGLPALLKHAEKIRLDERRGAVESPAFLTLCRQRAAALAWH
jgi:hypothetical protein